MKLQPFARTGLAALVLAGLGAYIYFVESKREDKPDKPKEKVLALDKAKARELTIAKRGGEAIALALREGSWTLTAPLQAPADGAAVEALLGSLESLEVEQVAVESPQQLADFGLESPRLSLGVLLEGASEPLKLLLGDKTPDGSGLYAKLPTQSRVFTVASYLEASLDKKPFDLRDRDLLKVKRDAIQALEVTGPEGPFALERAGAGDDWILTRPQKTRAGRWSVDSLLGGLEGLRMESVAAEAAKDLKPFGLSKPLRTVQVTLKAGGSRTLQIGSSPADKKHYAREAGSSLVAVIPGALVDDLAKGYAELRAKRLLDVATYEVEGFDALAEGMRRVYARSSSKDKDGVDVYKWKRTAPDAKDLDTNKVQDALFDVGGVEVQEFVDAPGPAASYGLDAPLVRVDLRYGQSRGPAWFELGRKGADFYGRRSDDDSVLKLDPAKAEALVKTLKEL